MNFMTRSGRSCAVLFAGLVAAAGCDSLLMVDIPGSVFEEDLYDPGFATTLATSAESEMECAFRAQVANDAVWAGEMGASGGGRDIDVWAHRQQFSIIFGAVNGCNTLTAHWTPLQIARAAGERSASIIGGFATADVPNKDFLIGKSLISAAYAYVYLGESYCQVAFDGGPAVSRDSTFRVAVDRFTRGMAGVSTVTSTEATNLMNLARVGRARAFLNLGDAAGVVADASLVPSTFVRNTFTATSPARLNAPIVNQNTLAPGGSQTVSRYYRNMTVGGVADPRVVATFIGNVQGQDKLAPYWVQRKYTGLNAPWRMASYREARLMLAEVQPANSVAIINSLRAAYPTLPLFASTDPTAIRDQVREERRRELWLEGFRTGDKLRWNEPWATGVSEHGSTFGTYTCMPIPEAEYLNNENIPDN